MKTFYFSKADKKSMGPMFILKAKNLKEAKKELRNKLQMDKLLGIILTFCEESDDD